VARGAAPGASVVLGAFSALKQPFELIDPCRRGRYHTAVGLHMRRPRHSYQCRGNSRRRPRKLQGSLQIIR
jgi:hypothetical protein